VPVGHASIAQDEPTRRLRRAERRDQILAAATRAFARSGFATTSLDEIAAEAHISRAILYRHFESKTDLYRSVLNRACARLADTVGTGDYTTDSVNSLLQVAAADPDGFRLLFHYAAREPEFRAEVDQLRTVAVDIAHRHLADLIAEPAWAHWASQLTPTVAVDAAIAWLDAGQPDRDRAADRVRHLLAAIVEAAQSSPTSHG
jgi:AcrR family transcriptional regulator